MKILSEILMFFERSRDAKKENTHIKQGNILIKAGLTLFTAGIILNITFSIQSNIQFSFIINSSIGWFVSILGAILILVGIIIIILGLSNEKKEWRLKKFYYLKGIDNQMPDPPIHALPKMAIWYHESPILLSIGNQSLNNTFDDLKFSMKMIEDKVEQYQSKGVFFAGIARIPCLFFIGYSFRNAHSKISLLEHEHQSDKWVMLEQVDAFDINLKIDSNIKNETKEITDIAITIEFTSEILKQELPLHLQSNLIRIKSTRNYSHNLITSQRTLHRIIEDIINELIKLNKKCNRLHLFISAQISVIFELGRRYQDGMIGNITIYNYDAIKKGYPWAISLTDNKIKLERFE